jgi:hypothetical protein
VTSKGKIHDTLLQLTAFSIVILGAARLNAQTFSYRDLTNVGGVGPIAAGTPAYYGSSTINVATFRDINSNLWQICSNNNGSTWQHQEIAAPGLGPGPSSIDPVASYDPSTGENAVLVVQSGSSQLVYWDANCNGIGFGINHVAYFTEPYQNLALPSLTLSSGTSLVYYTGTNSHIWRDVRSGNTWTGGDVWKNYQNPPQVVSGGIGAAYLGSSEAIDFAALDLLGTGYEILRAYRTGTSWYWDSLTTDASGSPEIRVTSTLSPGLALYSSSTVDIVAYLSSSNQICELYTNAGSWHWWCPASGGQGRPALAYTSQYHMVAYRDLSNDIYLLAHSTRGWHSYFIASSAVGDPTVSIIGNNVVVTYVSLDTSGFGHLWEAYGPAQNL